MLTLSYMLRLGPVNNALNDLFSVTYSVISYPILLIQNKYSKIKDYLFIILKYKDLYIENQKLTKQVQKLTFLSIENSSLKNLVNFQDNFTFSRITSRIVIEFFEGFKKQYLLNVGSINGINKGNAVIYEDKIMGRIIDISQRASRIQLMTDQDFKIAVLILKYGCSGIASGQNHDKYLKLSYLPQDMKIEDGQTVITLGEGNYIPYGIYVGKTKKIKNIVYIDIESTTNKIHTMVSVLRLEINCPHDKIQK